MQIIKMDKIVCINAHIVLKIINIKDRAILTSANSCDTWWNSTVYFCIKIKLNKEGFKMLKKFENQNKGITLIALVITIIIRD